MSQIIVDTMARTVDVLRDDDPTYFVSVELLPLLVETLTWTGSSVPPLRRVPERDDRTRKLLAYEELE